MSEAAARFVAVAAAALRAHGRCTVALGTGPRVDALVAALAGRDDVAWRTLVVCAADGGSGAWLDLWPLDRALTVPTPDEASLRAMLGPGARWPGFDLVVLEAGRATHPSAEAWVVATEAGAALSYGAVASAQRLLLLGPAPAPGLDDLPAAERLPG